MAKVKKKDLCCSYLDQKRYEKLPTTTLAKIIYKENSELFTNWDTVRSTLRQLRGAGGKNTWSFKAYEKEIKKYSKNNPGKLAPFAKIPKGKKHFAEWTPFVIKSKAALILSDAHIPYHDDVALETACEYGKEQKVDTVVLNGDFADFFSCSFWEKDPRERDFQGEIDTVLEALEYLRYMFPRKQIIWKIGNHEERFMRYMSVKAPELLGVDAFKFENIFKLDKYKITVVGDKRPMMFQDYTIIHGHEFYGGGGAQPAKAYLAKTKMNTISAHLHRTSYHAEKGLKGQTRSYSSGCLCDLHPDYSPVNQWNHGFVVIKAGKQGARVESIVIEDGQIV